MAGFERPGGQQGERSLTVAKQGSACTEQGAVEIGVDAAKIHRTRAYYG